MIVSELVAKLGFTVDGSGAKQFDSQMVTMRDRLTDFQNHINKTGNTAGAAMKGIAAGVGFAATNIAFSLAAAFGRGLVELGANFVQAGDDLTATMNRLSITVGPDNARAAYDALYKSARETGVAVLDTSKSFMAIQPYAAKAGMTVQQTVDMLDGLQKGMLASGETMPKIAETIRQISQGIRSNTLQGQEINSFLEGSSPTIIEAFAKAIGHTSEELKKLAAAGKLNREVSLRGFRAAAAAAQGEFASSATTVAAAWARAGVAVTDFLGKLNRLLGINRLLARIGIMVGNAFQWLASGVDYAQKFVDAVGGLRRVFWSIISLIAAYFMPAFLLALGPAAVAIIGSLSAVFSVLGQIISGLIVRMILLASPFAALALWFLVIEDFIMWMRGGSDTLFGDKFGDFDKVFDKIKDGIAQLRDYIFSFADEVTTRLLAIWRDFYAGLGPASQRILGLFGLTGQEGSGQAAAPSMGQAAVAGAGNWIEQQQSSGWMGRIFDAIARIDRYLPLPNLTGVNPTPPNAYNGPAQVSQNNTNNITVQATSSEPAAVATATQSGVTAANNNSAVRLGETMARGLLMASPRSEAAAQ